MRPVTALGGPQPLRGERRNEASSVASVPGCHPAAQAIRLPGRPAAGRGALATSRARPEQVPPVGVRALRSLLLRASRRDLAQARTGARRERPDARSLAASYSAQCAPLAILGAD